MALIKCPDCGNEVSENAPTCPKCGSPLKPQQPQTKEKKKTSGCVKVIGIVFAFIVALCIIIAIYGSSGSGPPSRPSSSSSAAPAPQIPAMEVSAAQFFDDYQANEVSADNKYKGKTLKITGTVSDISKDIMDNAVVHLQTSNPFMDILCTFKGSTDPGLANVKKGQQVVLIGKGDMMIMGSPRLENCQFAK
ncbi:MAG: zinc-ribbon domain-containing protein [Deltaproteobacteria bacterium]|jgi:hypothetical protein|nr:zinc-ribbon domain-containing protein [Deltaproteobacteria bacterium]